MEPIGQLAVVVSAGEPALMRGLSCKFFNEGLMFACAVAFVLSTIAGLVG